MMVGQIFTAPHTDFKIHSLVVYKNKSGRAMLLIDVNEMLVEVIENGKYKIISVNRNDVISLTEWLESITNDNTNISRRQRKIINKKFK